MNEQDRQDAEWWLGMADVLASGVTHGAGKLERVHLAIADETFDVLRRIPVTRPWSEAVRFAHHGISRLSYRTVAAVARNIGRLGQSLDDR